MNQIIALALGRKFLRTKLAAEDLSAIAQYPTEVWGHEVGHHKYRQEHPRWKAVEDKASLPLGVAGLAGNVASLGLLGTARLTGNARAARAGLLLGGASGLLNTVTGDIPTVIEEGAASQRSLDMLKDEMSDEQLGNARDRLRAALATYRMGAIGGGITAATQLGLGLAKRPGAAHLGAAMLAKMVGMGLDAGQAVAVQRLMDPRGKLVNREKLRALQAKHAPEVALEFAPGMEGNAFYMPDVRGRSPLTQRLVEGELAGVVGKTKAKQLVEQGPAIVMGNVINPRLARDYGEA